MYDSLSPKDQEFARTTKVEYAPHLYICMSNAKSRPDGLGLVSEGKELPLSDLPSVEWAKSKPYPYLTNPVIGKLPCRLTRPSSVSCISRMTLSLRTWSK